jgi:membrane protein DedA with SNARE-associated domain
VQALGWYVSIFAGLFFTGIGLPPLPEEMGILYACSVAAVEPDVRWWLAWPAASLGVMGADMVLYGVGRAFGPRLFEYRWVRHLVKPERRQRFERRFARHGIKILLTARLLPPLRTGVFILAGALRFSFVRFVLADLIYAVVGVGLFFLIGTTLVHLLHLIGHWGWYIGGALVALVALWHYYSHLRRREISHDAEPPISLLELPTEKTGPDLAPDALRAEAQATSLEKLAPDLASDTEREAE